MPTAMMSIVRLCSILSNCMTLLEARRANVAQRTDRVQIDYTLAFETPFHFGTGTRIGLIDRTVVRDAEEYLYVPGSTIKGVVREHCEQLARFYEDVHNKQLIASP